MSFGSFNKAFEPARTPFDWLSRDTAEVDKYIADPFCGFICTYGFFQGPARRARLDSRCRRRMAAIPKDLPIH